MIQETVTGRSRAGAQKGAQGWPWTLRARKRGQGWPWTLRGPEGSSGLAVGSEEAPAYRERAQHKDRTPRTEREEPCR